MNKFTAFWLVIILAVLSAGCSSYIKPEQPAVLDAVILDEAHSIGQTFVAQFDGMDGVEVYLEPINGADGEIQLMLREAPQSENLARASLFLKDISTPGFYRFQFPVQVDSNQQSYYLLLKLNNSGSIKVGTASGESYLNGALYQNHSPDNERQMAFQLSYYFPRVGLGLLGEMMIWVWYLLAAGFLFVIPGWAIMEAAGWGNLRQPKDQHWTIKLTVSIGVSLAFYTILFSFTNAIGLQLGSLYAWLPPIFGIIFLIWRYRNNLNKPSRSTLIFSWVDLSFIAILLIIFAARFWIIRAVPVPLWGDFSAARHHHAIDP